jgi:hypothetical protein
MTSKPPPPPTPPPSPSAEPVNAAPRGCGVAHDSNGLVLNRRYCFNFAHKAATIENLG